MKLTFILPAIAALVAYAAPYNPLNVVNDRSSETVSNVPRSGNIVPNLARSRMNELGEPLTVRDAMSDAKSSLTDTRNIGAQCVSKFTTKFLDSHCSEGTSKCHDDASPQLVARDQTLVITLGYNKQNIGDLNGGALYSVIWQALAKLCAHGDSTCTTGSKNSIKIPTQYVGKDHILRTGFLDVWIERAAWENEQLRDLLIGTIAGAVQKMPDDAKNCFDVEEEQFFNNYWHHHCNIAGFVGVELPGRFNIMDVHFEFPTNNGNFDCVAVRDAVDAKTQKLIPEFQQVLGIHVPTWVHCQFPSKHRGIEG